MQWARSRPFYSVEFNTASESNDVDILDWQYGIQAAADRQAPPILRARPSWVAQGEPLGGGDIGVMPVGDYLSVKWRSKNSGGAHEMRADRTNKLPADMNNYTIHWLVKGAQLYVFLFPPYTTQDALGRVTVHGGQPAGHLRGKAFLDLPYHRQHQIYPDSTGATGP